MNNIFSLEESQWKRKLLSILSERYLVPNLMKDKIVFLVNKKIFIGFV